MKYKNDKMAGYEDEDDDNLMYSQDEMYYDKNFPRWGHGIESEYHGYYDMMEEDCCMPKIKCKPTKECIHTYKCYYKLYKICHYQLYKVCPRCGHEFDYYRHRGMCPKCM